MDITNLRFKHYRFLPSETLYKAPVEGTECENEIQASVQWVIVCDDSNSDTRMNQISRFRVYLDYLKDVYHYSKLNYRVVYCRTKNALEQQGFVPIIIMNRQTCKVVTERMKDVNNKIFENF
jgi:hypothetical protein